MGCQILDVRGLSDLVIWCFSKKLCLIHDAWAGILLWWNCPSPVAYSCSLLNHLNSFCRDMFKLNAKFDTDLLLYSVILNGTATQYTSSLNDIYHPHWLGQWSHHCLHRCIPVNSPWLPGYIDIIQTVLIILTMPELFWDIPHLYIYIYIYKIKLNQESGISFSIYLLLLWLIGGNKTNKQTNKNITIVKMCQPLL